MKAPLAHHRGRRYRAKLIPFPLAHQRPLVAKLAARMAAQIPARAEKTLNAELQRRIDALHRQGLSDSTVERQVKAFEAAIRADLWRIVLLPPSPDDAA
jgi:membrane carboxypeptidase/penicillin-binding protein PbpC